MVLNYLVRKQLLHQVCTIEQPVANAYAARKVHADHRSLCMRSGEIVHAFRLRLCMAAGAVVHDRHAAFLLDYRILLSYCPTLSHRVTFNLDCMRVIDNPVTDCIGHGRVI